MVSMFLAIFIPVNFGLIVDRWNRRSDPSAIPELADTLNDESGIDSLNAAPSEQKALLSSVAQDRDARAVLSTLGTLQQGTELLKIATGRGGNVSGDAILSTLSTLQKSGSLKKALTNNGDLKKFLQNHPQKQKIMAAIKKHPQHDKIMKMVKSLVN